MARSDTTQSRLTDETFETERTNAEEDSPPDAAPETGTATFAERMDTPVGRVEDTATRKALLEAGFGTRVVVAGREYTLARQFDEPLRCVLAAPKVQFVDADEQFYLTEDALVPESGVCDDGTPAPDAEIPLTAVHVQDEQAGSLATVVDRMENSDARVTRSRECPACNSTTTAFQEDDVETTYKSEATALPANPTVEVRYCHECEQTFLCVREVTPDTATIKRTRNLYGLKDDPVEIGGLYTLNETCLFKMVRETDAYKGLWTASEVAAFVNAKLDDSGEEGELFGFVTVQDGGDRVVWHDDQPYDYECEFRRVDAEVIAARNGGDQDGDEQAQPFVLSET